MKNKQRSVLRFIEKYIVKNCSSPSYQDICDGVGIKSRSHVHYIIKDLEYLGLIERTNGKYRSFKLPKKYNALKLKQEIEKLKKSLKECREMAFSIRLALSSGKINNVFSITYKIENEIDNAMGEI